MSERGFVEVIRRLYAIEGERVALTVREFEDRANRRATCGECAFANGDSTAAEADSTSRRSIRSEFNRSGCVEENVAARRVVGYRGYFFASLSFFEAVCRCAVCCCPSVGFKRIACPSASQRPRSRSYRRVCLQAVAEYD